MFIKVNRHLLSFIVFIFCLISISCSQSRVTVDAELNSIEIAPLLNSISLGAEIQLSATAFYDNNSKQSATTTVEWTSSDTSIFNITPDGKLKSLAAGTGTITATLDSISTSIDLGITAATLTSLNINPANPEIYTGTQIELTVFGLYDDGSKLDLTNSITWQSEPNTILTRVSNIVTGASAGSTRITANYADTTAATTISVKNATLNEIQFDLGGDTFHAGNSIKLRAVGIFSDGKKQDISELVSWSYTSQPALPVYEKDNSLSVNAAGQLTIAATLNNISSSQTITISPATLQTIEVFSLLPNITVGDKLQLQAVGYYSDGKNVDLSALVSWSSSDKTVLEISNSINFEGQSISKKSGAVTASASIGNISGNVDITITPAILTKIDISHQRQNIAIGTSLPLVATGIYSDNSSLDLTNAVTWSSQDTSIIHVNNQYEKAGLASGLSVGTSKIYAKLGNITSNTEITVTDATLIDINISNFSSVAIINTSIPLEAIGIFSDGSTQQLTDIAVWHSSQPDKVSISNSDTNAGILEAISIGNSAISATYNNITATENIEVSDAILTGITLQSDFLSLAKDSSSQLQAIGSLSNGHTQNISNLVNWSSDAPDILSIDNSKNKKGIITAKTSGTANISATLNNISESTTITVSNATLASIEVSHQNVRIANGTKLNIIATGIYSDGTHQNITQDVLWLSDNPASVFVSNEKGKKGDTYSLSVGSALVSATQGSTIGTSNITVNAKLLSAITILADGNNMLAAGNEVQLKAIGNYSDGSILDISNQVTWQSSDNKICIVSTSEQHYGLIKAKTAGTCNVTAKAEQVSNSLLFTISDATLQSISISPNNTSLPRGTKIQLIATGLYSDATTSDISKTVSWKSNNIFTSISEELNTKGLLSAIDIGSSTITATYDTISATSTATVNAATLESIAISALITGDFINGTTKTYIATGTYSDQSTQDISQLVLWVSSDTTVSTANNSITSAGKFSGIAAGAVSLSAAFNGITSSPLNTTVIDVPLAPVSLSLRATPNIILNDGADTSSISLNVQAADNLQAVADGTEIQLSIINGSGIISSSAVTTINGEAAFNITSTTKGLVTVKATITGTEISNYVSVYATDNFAEVIAKYGFATGSLVNGLVAIDSKFGFLIINFANRPFIVNGYRVFNGNTIITETSDPAVLNNNLLPAGGNILVVYASTEALSNNYVVAYYLTEPDTGSQFAIIGGFQLSSTNPGPVP